MKSNRRIHMRPGKLTIALLFLLVPVSSTLADDDGDTALFRMTDIDGYFSVNYLNDEIRTGSANTASSTTSFREELFINTHSYLYHPNLLKMDFGMGPVWAQNRVTSGNANTSDNASLYNLSTKFMFLEQKPYSLTVFYDHLNPVFSTSIGQSFIQTNTKYGSTLILREPFSPFLIILDNSHQVSDGEGLAWKSKDDIHQTSARIYKSINPGDHIQLTYQKSDQNTASGNPGISITPTAIDSQNLTFDSRLLLGERKQVTNTNTIIHNAQTYNQSAGIYQHRDFSFTPDLVWQHSNTLTSFYRYNFFSSTDRDIDTMRQSGKAGLNIQIDKDFTASGGFHSDSQGSSMLRQNTYGGDMKIRYNLPVGETNALQLGANVNYDRTERLASVSAANIYGEQMQLAGTDTVSLLRPYIDTSTIKVFNLTRTQQYCPDTTPLPAGCTVADYRIIVIGSITQIQRLVTGNILDGQLLLVDYSYQTGGDAQYSALDWGVQANFRINRAASLFANYRQSDFNLTYGAPTIPLNPVRNRQYGARMDQPLESGYSAGGEILFEQQDEEFSPYTRNSYFVYLQTPVYLHSTLRFSTRHVWMDYLKSAEDINLAGWSIRMNTGPWANAVLTAEYSREQDDGGSLARGRDQLTLGANWNFRDLSMRAEGLSNRELQGGFQREYSLLRILLTRRF